MSVLAASLMMLLERSRALRLAYEMRWALEGQWCFCVVLTFTLGGTVMVNWSQQTV